MKFYKSNSDIEFFNSNKGNIYSKKFLYEDIQYEYRYKLIAYSEHKKRKNDIWFILESEAEEDGIYGFIMQRILNHFEYNDNLNLNDKILYRRVNSKDFFKLFVKI